MRAADATVDLELEVVEDGVVDLRRTSVRQLSLSRLLSIYIIVCNIYIYIYISSSLSPAAATPGAAQGRRAQRSRRPHEPVHQEEWAVSAGPDAPVLTRVPLA
jgi:hypothetical protein